MMKREQNDRQTPKEVGVEIENMAFVRGVNEHKQEHDEVDREYFDKLPPGYRFKPTGEELIVHYLMKKVSNLPLPINRIRDVNLYNFHPQQLANMYRLHREKELYFFTPRDKKYPNGSRPDRSAGNGYWKATGADTIILSNGVKVGTKKSLVYYEGKSKDKNGKKTEWIMHEYRIAAEEENDINNGVGPIRRAPNDMKLDDCVLCMMYKKDKLPKKPDQGNEPNGIAEEENNTVIDVQVPNPGAGHEEGVNHIVNVPVLNEQVPSQNQVQRIDFNHRANAPMVNEKVFNPNPIQEGQFNHEYTRFSAGHYVYNYNQFGSVNTLPYEPSYLSLPNKLDEPVEIQDYPLPLDYKEDVYQYFDNGVWKTD